MAPEQTLEDIVRLASASGLGIIRFDAGLRAVLANETAHRLLERAPGGLEGRTPMEAFVDHRLDDLVRSAVAGQEGSLEIGDGDARRLLILARPAADGGAVVSLQDVTNVRRLERIRTEFVDNLSHELRTPLASIRLLTELLLDDIAAVDVPERVRERVATIDVETGHLAQMVAELLDLSRMEQAGGDMRREPVTLTALVSAVLARLETFAARQEVTLRAQVPPEVPAVRGDEERLETLLGNLIHNAIKFSPAGGSVQVSAVVRDGEVVIAVADEGPGIPRADQDRIFERFYKVDRARQRGAGGTGLGLAIARHIAEGHGGRIWLRSTEGAGATFLFSVPLA